MGIKACSRALALLCALAAFAAVARGQDEDYDYYDYDMDDVGAGGGEVDESDVVVLTDDSFDETLSNHKYAMVEFYAPWCGHCKSLAPEYAEAATQLKADAPEVLIAKVDATVEEAVSGRFGIEGFPTIKWFVDGDATDYSGERSADAIIKFVMKKTGPPAATAESAEEAAEFKAKASKVYAVGLFTAFSGPEFEAFQKVAAQDDKIDFVQTTSAAVAEALALPKGVTFGLVRDFDEPAVLPAGKAIDEFEMLTLIKENRLPLVIPFSQESAEDIFGSGIDSQLLLFVGSDMDAEEAAEETFHSVAKELKGKLVFVSVNMDEEIAGQVAEFFGLEADIKEPVVMGYKVDEEAGRADKFKFPKGAAVTDADTLLTFASSIADGSAQPYYKSEDEPEEPQDKGAVNVVVGTTFEKVCFDESKDVLLEVYAPWCGHCKSLEPTYKKLAKRFKDVDSVVIAKLDGTANEHPKLEVEGFPTLYFFPSGSDEMVPFEGERTLKGMTKFIKQNAKIDFELPKKPKGDADGASPEHDEL
mmetsp:Transcript_13651/g.44912  ORF Transcript_13651/g.44912 Transcript_13651/m.44912 type:complete len:531 (-) Transcript_13651:554-2146(-)